MITVTHSKGQTKIQSTDLAGLRERVAEAWIVTDENVAKALEFESAPRLIVVPAGEASKSWSQAGELQEWLAGSGATRRSEVAAVGGGVVGDLAGFAAASYMRGVPLVQVPTSLLAMVDSSVGGKTGVDLRSGKNLAGAFWPAREVLIAVDALRTLPEREWQCGSAEIWKYGAIMDAALWERLEREPIKPTCPHLEETIWRCIDLKRTVVEQDEYETTGLRAILNFGHTVGHAIEWALGYKELTHGEAIAIGMVVEAEIGEEIGFSERGSADVIRNGMERQGLPTAIPARAKAADLIQAMRRDKKALPGMLGMSLLETIGTCKLVTGVSEEAASRVLARS